MERAVVLIGVARSGLPTLPAVPAALAAMRRWATEQGIPDDLVVELSDTDGRPVRLSDVFDAVSAIAARLTVEQLVVFFCGHGVYTNQTDLWLLSGAPGNPNEAVNLEATVRLASRGAIPYVVTIADACRSATSTVQFSDVTGGSIFPSPAVVGGQSKVDRFSACRLGDVATQIASPTDPATFRATYSEVMAEALEGDYADVLEEVADAGTTWEVVRASKLEECLPQLMALRLDELGKALEVDQVPTALVTSGPNRWVARLSRQAGTPGRRGPGVADSWVGAGPPTPPDPAAAAADAAVQRLVAGWMHDGTAMLPARGADAALVVVGARAVEAHVPGGSAETTDVGVVLELQGDRRVRPVLVRLDGGRCVVVPGVPGLVGLLTFEDEAFVDLRYAPLDQPAGGEAQWRQSRSRLAAATRFGLPWWVGTEALTHPEPAVLEADPALLVYLAHALDAIGDEEGLQRLLPEDPEQQVPYDLALVTDQLDRRATVPGFPLLTRGWALLGPAGLAEQPDLPARVASPWTLFADGFERLRDHLDDVST